MDDTLRQQAVDDLLEYCRNPQHVMNAGRHLAPVLLKRTWRGVDDDYHLVTVVKALLQTELARWRQTLGLPSAPDGDAVDTVHQLRDPRVTQHRSFETIMYVWAYYIDQFTTAYLAEQLSCSTRSIQLKVAAGRAEVARLVLLHEHTPMPEAQYVHSQAAQNGHHPTQQPDDGTVPSRLPESVAVGQRQRHDRDDSHVPPVQEQATPHAIHQHIAGDNVQAVIGPIGGSVRQSQTHHHYHGDDQPGRTYTSSDNTLFWACLLVIMVAGFWLIRTVPWLSIGSLLLISMWRTVRHGWSIRQIVVREASGEDVNWQVGYLLAWFGALGWAVILMRRLSGVLTTADFSFERLMLIVAFVSVSAYVFWLCTLDLLLWVDNTVTPRWPWRLIEHHADWVWQRRWVMLGLTWLMLLVFSGSMLLFSFGSG